MNLLKMRFLLKTVVFIFFMMVITLQSFAESFDRQSGVVVGLDVIVSFPDKPMEISKSEIEHFCNVDVFNYFYKASRGKLEYTNIVLEYTTKSNSTEYSTSFAVASEVVDWLKNTQFDLSQLSVHSDNGAIRSFTLHTYQSDINTTSFVPYPTWNIGDHKIEGYAWVIEHFQTPSLGRFVHEQGHQLFRWPDLYDYGWDGGRSNGIGTYGIHGIANSSKPQQPNPYFLSLMGWITPTIIHPTDNHSIFTLPATEDVVYQYNNPNDPTEYFLIESTVHRGTVMGDNEGIFIWHIDEDAWQLSVPSYWWNQNEFDQMTPLRHYTVAIEQADYRFDIEGFRSIGDTTDHFLPQQGIVFDDMSYPDARWWDNSNSGLRIADITQTGNDFEFTFLYTNLDLSLSNEDVKHTVNQGSSVSDILAITNNSADEVLSFEIQQPHNGYRYKSSVESSDLEFNWTSISQNPQSEAIIFPYPQEAVRIDLPFSFPYYEKSYEAISVFAKGCLTLMELDNIAHDNDSLPSLRMVPTLISPYLSYSTFDENTKAYILTSSDSVIIEFVDVQQYRRSEPDVMVAQMTFQVVLFNDGRISFNYLKFDETDSHSTIVGIQNEKMDRGLTVTEYSTMLGNEMTIVFEPITDYYLDVETTTGSLLPGETFELPYTYNSNGMSISNYRDEIQIRHNARNFPNPLIVPFTLTVEGECGESLLESFSVPRKSALPSVSTHYSYTHVLGIGPDLTNITGFTFNWDLNNNGLYQMAMHTNDGLPHWYVDLRSNASWSLNSINPEILLSATGFSGLDGEYFMNLDGNNIVLVEKTGQWAVYFSESATPPEVDGDCRIR